MQKVVSHWGCAIALAVAAAGCGRSRPEPAKAPVSGRVTLDGKPLSTGEVFFISTKGQSADRLTITDGVFSGKVSIGPQKIQIASYKVRRASVMPGMPEEELRENILPDEYGPLSDIVVEVAATTNPQLSFDIKSRPARPGRDSRPDGQQRPAR